MTAPVVRVTEGIGTLFDDGEGRLYLSLDDGMGPVEGVFPEAAHTPLNGGSGKRGRFKVVVEFEEEER